MSFIVKNPQNIAKFGKKITRQRNIFYFSTSTHKDNKVDITAENLGVKDKATKDDDYQEIALKFQRDWKKHYAEPSNVYTL